MGSEHNSLIHRFEVVLSVVLYSLCSISMILLNKLVVATYGLNYPFAIIFLQNVSALILVAGLKRAGLVSYPSFDKGVAQKWVPLTLFFVTMLISSVKSLHTMSVAVQTIIKNLAVVLTALGDRYFFSKQLSPQIMASFGLMIIGSYLGSVSDKWVTAWGLFWTIVNVLSTVGYVLYMKLLLHQVSQEIGRYGPVYYNNLLSLPFLFFPGALSAEGMVESLGHTALGGHICLALMLFVGAIMTFASFWCMKMCSPTTYSVMGSLNKIPLTFLGIVIFNTYPTMIGAVGISISLSGGIMYAIATTRATPKKQDDDDSSRLSEVKTTGGESGGSGSTLRV
eukprot:PhM_4_TR2915/c0_g1_i2/m.1143/K15356/VRG4, GONST1; GDP-mannose transporter